MKNRCTENPCCADPYNCTKEASAKPVDYKTEALRHCMEAKELRRERDILRHALAKYGDRLRMSVCANVPMQQVIDDALSAASRFYDDTPTTRQGESR